MFTASRISPRALQKISDSVTAFLITERAAQPRDAVSEPVGLGGEAPPQITFAFRTERGTRREPESVLAHQALAEGEAVAQSLHAQERVHRAVGHGRLDLRQLSHLGDP